MAKERTGKPELGLIYYTLMEEVAKVRTYGVAKYGSRSDWREVPVEDYYDAAIRHLIKAKSAALDEQSQFSERDKESGLLHLSHAAGNIMFLIERTCNKEQ